MAAGKYDITIEQGAVFERTITVHDRDLTGYEARMHIRKTYDATTPLLTLTSDGVDGRITITPGTDSTITLHVDATDTATLALADFHRGAPYDLELVPPAGEDDVERLLEGRVLLSPEVTKEVAA